MEDGVLKLHVLPTVEFEKVRPDLGQLHNIIDEGSDPRF